MKTKHHLLRIFLVVLGITSVFAYAFYLFMDYGINGFFRDWFADTFIITQTVYDASREAYVTYDQIHWYALKQFLLFFLIVAVLFIVFLVLISMYVYGKIKESKILSSLNEMIETYRKNDLEMEAAFSKSCCLSDWCLPAYLHQKCRRQKNLVTCQSKSLYKPQ